MEKAQEWNKEKLVHFLETAPLYSTIAFEGNYIPNYSKFDDVVSELSFYCPKCKTDQLFHSNSREDCVSLQFRDYDYIPPNPPNGFLDFSLYCSKNDCRLNKKIFVYYTHEELVDKSSGTISHVTLTKCGEYPSLAPRVDEVILKVFPKDAELLKKAVHCLKDGFGVGAFAYLRQALDDRIDIFLAEIRKNAEVQGDTKALQELNQLHEKSKVADKIEIAKKALPAGLQMEGHNPLGLLYKTLSDGIHGLSDTECLGKANAIYGALTYILKTLAENSASRKEYEESLKSLSK